MMQVVLESVLVLACQLEWMLLQWNEVVGVSGCRLGPLLLP